ncbi:ABC transporter ATP-binding protein [Aureimonas jatrophae]|uniref:Amino acid/amide ABC transporter ATP-binding protein 1, HAAT family n=1 Tax=Aureimonas jatrophae TaxID=1166073 RepID=A0A1H0EZH6_9HYPH|nr:ABC transporter ATP-binding protein [Aureimonas jatrophae]MBB3950244.1 branched-chain amino acid transport system ATP-binding protein [Aureimonas jatrophae]SDN87788.1 amino acid/amide ABC transporter ATP-binding protein 1, HAAT family [Aureimonas jatrophae]
MSALLEIRGLRKRFGGLAVTDGVDLALEPGARTALIGPNGAGKTTLINLVTGQLLPDAGTVTLDGRDVTRAPTVERVRAGLVRSFQVTRLFPDLSPRDHLALAILQRENRSGRMFGHYERDPALTTEIDALLAGLRLAEIGRRPVAEIAYGQQRLVELAIALALRPRVLLLDEPAAGVPQNETRLIEEALAELPAELAVLMIDHDMDLVFRFAREVVVLAAGRVIFAGPASAVASDRGVREAYLGSYADARAGG